MPVYTLTIVRDSPMHKANVLALSMHYIYIHQGLGPDGPVAWLDCQPLLDFWTIARQGASRARETCCSVAGSARLVRISGTSAAASTSPD